MSDQLSIDRAVGVAASALELLWGGSPGAYRTVALNEVRVVLSALIESGVLVPRGEYDEAAQLSHRFRDDRNRWRAHADELAEALEVTADLVDDIKSDEWKPMARALRRYRKAKEKAS